MLFDGLIPDLQTLFNYSAQVFTILNLYWIILREPFQTIQLGRDLSQCLAELAEFGFIPGKQVVESCSGSVIDRGLEIAYRRSHFLGMGNPALAGAKIIERN